MTKDEIFELAKIRGPHAGSGCLCNGCLQAEALALAVEEIERLRVNRDHSCTCPHQDASEPIKNHDSTCPIRVNRIKRIAPEVALDRLATALNSNDLVVALQAALNEACDLAEEANGDPSSCSYVIPIAERIIELRKLANV